MAAAGAAGRGAPRAACPTLLPPGLRGPPGPARGLKPRCRGCKHPRTPAPCRAGERDPPPTHTPPPAGPAGPVTPYPPASGSPPARPSRGPGRGAPRPTCRAALGRWPLASGRDAATLPPPAGGSACPAPPPAQLPRLPAPLTSRPAPSGPRALVRAVAGARARRERCWGGGA